MVFLDKQIKRNSDKCHVIVWTDDVAETKIENSAIKYSNQEKLLGVKTDNKLNFDRHVRVCAKKQAVKQKQLL